MKISNQVERIDGTMANSYLVKTNGINIIIDAGTPGSGKKIIEFLESAKIKPDIVLITHYHVDHTGGLYTLYEKYHMEIYVPTDELTIISGSEPVPSRPFMPKLASTITHARKVKELKPLSEMKVSGIEIVKTPGHTRDSTSYFFKEENILFSGDACVNIKGSPGYTRIFSVNVENAEKSLNNIKSKNALILPGHGDKMDFRTSV